MTETKPYRILATYVPQAWIDDYAVEIDGRVEFDVTEPILAMPRAEALAIRDDQYESDALVPEGIGAEHTGPFYVKVEGAISAYFAEEESDANDSGADQRQAAQQG